tara:strand:- start:2364 stop:2912 length:549 start_codon:yes stop_codon:yes gene_type:complete
LSKKITTESESLERKIKRDPESRALAALHKGLKNLPPKRQPHVSLQLVADLSKKLTRATYVALSITDKHDRVEGFITSGLSNSELARLSTPPQGHGPLGSLRLDGRPVHFENVQNHAKAFGFPSNHPEMTAMIGVAIWVSGSVRGALYATDRKGNRGFNLDDEVILSALASHAGRVIETEWY